MAESNIIWTKNSKKKSCGSQQEELKDNLKVCSYNNLELGIGLHNLLLCDVYVLWRESESFVIIMPL